jgi:excisionase family DNA binding protein
MRANIHWPPKRYLDVPETADYTRRSEAAIRRLVHLEKIPFLKQGRRVAFDIEELDDWMHTGY